LLLSMILLWPESSVQTSTTPCTRDNTSIGPALQHNIDEFLQAKLGVSADKAAAMRVELFRTHGSSLAGLLCSLSSRLLCSSATAHFISGLVASKVFIFEN